MYIQGVLPWNSSKWIAPPPDQIAKIRAEAGTAEGDPEIGIARGDSNIQPAPEKDSLDDSETSGEHQEKVAEREAQQARENADVEARAQHGE